MSNLILRPKTIHHPFTLYGRMKSLLVLTQQDLVEWELTFDSIPDPIAIIDRDHRLVRVNKAMAAKLGLSKDDCVGRICYECIHGTNSPPAFCPHAKSLCDGEVHSSQVTEEKTLGGCFEVTTTPIKDQQGNVSGSVHIARDVTLARQAANQLAELNKKLNLLSSVTRHDILNQLMVLSGNLGLLKTLESRDERLTHISKMERAISTIRHEIEFTKDYERLGRAEPIWHDVESVVRAALSKKDLADIEVRTELRGLEILADAMLEKVFHNLLDNTTRHGGKVSQIWINAEKKPDGVAIVYEDDGVGIPSDEKEKIFLKGFGKNTGYGLFLSREILNITDLRISEKGVQGKGARFELFVPENRARWP